MTKRSLDGKVALVTGSSRGIGAAIAREFAAQGARVALHGRNEEALAAVRQGIVASGGEAMQVAGDVTKFQDIEGMRQKIEAQWGPVDLLVANAGGNFTPPSIPFEEISEDSFKATIDGNLTATFLTIKSLLPGMKRRGSGNIIAISSAAARRAHPGSPIPYSVAKVGILLMMQDLALQVGPQGIRVNCIAPETIMTENNQARIPKDQQEKLVAMHPIRRLGTPADVARAASFLASEDASWLTGVILDVAGGAVLV